MISTSFRSVVTLSSSATPTQAYSTTGRLVSRGLQVYLTPTEPETKALPSSLRTDTGVREGLSADTANSAGDVRLRRTIYSTYIHTIIVHVHVHCTVYLHCHRHMYTHVHTCTCTCIYTHEYKGRKYICI